MDNLERREMLLKELEIGATDNAPFPFFANMLGYTTAEFSNVLQKVPGFPGGVRLLSGETLYPVSEASRALLDHYDAALRVETLLPRGEGADAPQSELADGEMALMYTEQNFNSLAAANTAMQTEISSLLERANEKDQVIQDLRDRIDELRVTNRDYLTQVKDLQAHDKDMKSRLDDAAADVDYHRDNAASLQRKLDRSLGYLDRVIDDQEGSREPEKRTVAPPPIGPDLGAIPEARRRSRNGIDMMAIGDSIHFTDPAERRRRY